MAKKGLQRGIRRADPPPPALVLPPRPPLALVHPPRTPFWQVVVLPTLGAMTLVASVWFYTRPVEEPPSPGERSSKTVRISWNASTDEDRLVEAFQKARNKDGKSTLNLAPDPVFDDKPVSEAEAEALQSHYILHRVKRVVAIRAGEPGKGTKWLPTPHRYTLTTKVGVATPKVAVQVGDRIEAPNLIITNPDIIVEVRNGKIHALRAEIHRE